MNEFFAFAGGVVGTAAACAAVAWAAITSKDRRKRREQRQERKKNGHRHTIACVTRWLFISTQVTALMWVSTSYAIAIYATVRLGMPFPVVELSQQAIITILGATTLKVIENIFEHNEGGIWGRCRCDHPHTDAQPPPAEIIVPTNRVNTERDV